jgi:hypothetical protein
MGKIEVTKDEIKRVEDELIRQGLRIDDARLVTELLKRREEIERTGMKGVAAKQMKSLLSKRVSQKQLNQISKKFSAFDREWFEGALEAITDPNTSEEKRKEEIAMAKLSVGCDLKKEEKDILLGFVKEAFKTKQKIIPKKILREELEEIKKAKEAMLAKKFEKKKGGYVGKRKRSGKRK